MHSPASPPRVAVIGGGWAGMAAAVQLHQQGWHVQVLEASRHWGGRARALPLQGPDGQRWVADNGQHILIGAYQACLECMRAVGVDPAAALLRLPLDLRYADGQGLQLPDLPPPWDAAIGIARARGWSWRDKLALLHTASQWQRNQFVCAPHATVADLCRDLPRQLVQDFVEPLCISALNLPSEQASGSIFLRVLQDGLFSGRGGSNLLIPRTDLSRLWPSAAADWLQQRGADLQLGTRVQHIAAAPQGDQWQVNASTVDAIVLATSSTEAARLVQQAQLHSHQRDQAQTWAATAQALPHTAIATVYAHSQQRNSEGHVLPAPMVALRSHAQAPAQFAFDKSRIDGQQGLIALVVSASEGNAADLEQHVITQARTQLQLHDLQPIKTVIDKRATFACTPQVVRPDLHIAPRWVACGDYVKGPYPATLEGAVRSGQQAAQALLAQHPARLIASDTTE